MDVLDNKLPETYRVWISMVFSTLASLLVMVITTPTFIAVIVPAVLLCAFLLVGIQYMKHIILLYYHSHLIYNGQAF